MPRPFTAALRRQERFSIDAYLDRRSHSTLAEDVRRGLARPQKAIPSKYFYDDRGSRLFERICELPEYYLTRAEQALLEGCARNVLATARPTDVIELGSGAARKTKTLLDAAAAEGFRPRYHPFDVCEPMIRSSAAALLAEYPWLEVHAMVADYERHLQHLPGGDRRLVAFLGSTIGNYTLQRAAAFVRKIGRRLRRGEFLLLGADLVKPVDLLEAAYNDAAGVTAEFNRNVLRVVNRELDGDFEPGAFEHVAFFDERHSWMEMHLRATRAMTVTIRKLDMVVELSVGETIHTEISRKFTERGLRDLCRQTGFRMRGWYVPEDRAFGLVLAEKT